MHLQSAGNSTVVQNFKFDPEESLKKFYKAVIMHDYPFKMVDHEFFVDFIKSLRPHFAFKCRITTRNDIMKIYSDEKKMLFDQLKLQFQSLSFKWREGDSTLGAVQEMQFQSSC